MLLVEGNVVKPFFCSFQGCEAKFTTVSSKNRHEKIHLGIRPFRCTYVECKKSFSRNYDLKLHSLIHEKKKPFICSKCEKKFSHPSALSRHNRDCHNKQISDKGSINFIIN
eukprot:TRINITY_DN7121_c0_g1_i1.p1 TRINITY_DN7121_c0_g1~~TRINITY_DN7121_c0_g1_i1.p1  ORF type:complete len:111 (+),score=12.31 TRINITY_DN7121_c0_g1_i1:1-333(+)